MEGNGIAAYVLRLGNNPEWKLSEGTQRRRIFLTELGYAMVMPHTQKIMLIPTLQSHVRAAMNVFGMAEH